ncbi:MAG: Wzy polymerase domain-containing protein [Burkholderiaceae bacterium]|nr:Wzy polymerase domain-containing protein [Burkholderiaceae bacterium]
MADIVSAAGRPDPNPSSMSRCEASPGDPVWLTVTACLAVVPAALLAVNLPPSATFLNQAAAVSGWGLFCAVVAWRLAPAPSGTSVRWGAGLKALLAALVLLMLACAGSWALTGLPASLALSAIGMLSAAGLVACVGAAAMSAGQGAAAFRALCLALVVAGLLSVAVGAVQVFAPHWADGQWIAITVLEGRAAGNLRQPNHLSSLLLWSFIAALWLAESMDGARLAARPGRYTGLLVVVLVLIFGLVLSASRTGMLGVLALAVWGALDRNLSRRTRLLLCLSPLIYAVCWVGLTVWADASGHVFGGAARLRSEADISSSRFGIWADTLGLIAQRPWFGVGWGEFNLAWSLTPFPGRPGAFFDHTHNLLLQFVVELGVPLALVVTALLTRSLWLAWKAGGVTEAERGRAPAALVRFAWMMVLLVAWHSLLEYPLWYAYFLLPAALAWGLCLGVEPQTVRPTNPASAARTPARPLWFASMALTAGGALSVIDYIPVVAIFAPGDEAPPLAERIAEGRRSVLFSHHADYAAATTRAAPAEVLRAMEGARHFLLDTRLMTAWAQALADSGDVERARHIAARLREFHNPASMEFFAPCSEYSTPAPFQCAPPATVMDDRDFR